MSKSLQWHKDAAEGDHLRMYRLDVQARGKWLVTIFGPDAKGALARGWALSPDEAKQIAQEWEDGFRRYEDPQRMNKPESRTRFD